MSENAAYTPPEVWTWDAESGGQFAKINRPIAGATHEKTLPVGKHPLQLYSLGTPNGVKVTIMLEELLALGHAGAEYDAWLIKIQEGDQFGSGFVEVNPNSKTPALLDRSGTTTRLTPAGELARAAFTQAVQAFDARGEIAEATAQVEEAAHREAENLSQKTTNAMGK